MCVHIHLCCVVCVARSKLIPVGGWVGAVWVWVRACNATTVMLTDVWTWPQCCCRYSNEPGSTTLCVMVSTATAQHTLQPQPHLSHTHCVCRVQHLFSHLSARSVTVWTRRTSTQHYQRIAHGTPAQCHHTAHTQCQAHTSRSPQQPFTLTVEYVVLRCVTVCDGVDVWCQQQRADVD